MQAVPCGQTSGPACSPGHPPAREGKNLPPVPMLPVLPLYANPCPLPLYVNYDFKRVTQFNPGDGWVMVQFESPSPILFVIPTAVKRASAVRAPFAPGFGANGQIRSEEHTSELQSR